MMVKIGMTNMKIGRRMMVKMGIPSNSFQAKQGSLGNVGARRFVVTYFQADNCGASSGDEEGTRDNSE